VHYPIPLHLQPASRELGYRRGDFPACEAEAAEIVTLPAHQHLGTAELDYVVEQVRRFYRE
jgi:dTDP-4-amino-4,6-dideoxygalactose transaminase